MAAWSGLWGLTWRTVWAPRRWPVLALLILANPVLAWFALQTDELNLTDRLDLTVELDPTAEADLPSGWLNWVTRFHFGLVVPLWCLIAFGSMIRDEVQAGTIGFLLTRPLTRLRFFIVRWLCTLATTQVPLALNTILLGVVALMLGVQGAVVLTILLLGAQLVVVPAYGAIAAFLGLLTRKYLLVGLVYGFVVEIGIGQIPTNINTLSVARHFRTLLAQFELIVKQADGSAGQWLSSVGALLLLTLVYVAAGSLLFNLREYSQSEENKH
jgi:ABC-2 type transport system permease protein